MLYVVLERQQAAVTDTTYGTVQGSLIDIWLAWPIGSMLDSKQSCAEASCVDALGASACLPDSQQ